ncbi:MAG: site-specific integrase [bacterium]|nr:site-specific integrase [bacterium]
MAIPATYNDGKPYRPARGRHAPRSNVERFFSSNIHPVVRGRPSPSEFLRKIRREMKIRCYQQKTIKAYINALRVFLRWRGGMPHEVSSENVRDYLETLVDGGGSSSWVSINLSAIRTAFDKMCGRSITLGLQTPRRPKRLPTVLSKQEVAKILQAAPTLRDKLLLGLMYATGLRVSEVVRLKWMDLDFDRRTVTVRRGKHQTDRQVMLPESFAPLLQSLSKNAVANEFLFCSEAARKTKIDGSPMQIAGRHLSPRTAQRAVGRAAKIAGVNKPVTPHTLRHAFATHLLENGTDIRFIQKLLGHVRLETTTIYTKVAVFREQQIASPADELAKQNLSLKSKPVGRLRICLSEVRTQSGIRSATAALHVERGDQRVVLEGIIISESMRGELVLQIPPLEAWRPGLRRLPVSQRERFSEPSFYELLREQIGIRFYASG